MAKDYDGAMDFAYMWAERAKNPFGSVNSNSSNYWNDFDGEIFRDHNAVYPTVDGVIDTIQWEGFREGVDDVRYLSTLLDRVAYAKTKGINVASIEQWIANIKASDLSGQNLDQIRTQMATYINSLPESVNCTSKTYFLPKVDIKANGFDKTIEIEAGEPVEISWTSNDATKCVAADGWSGEKDLNGNISQRLNQPKTYSIVCSNSAGIARDSITIKIKSSQLQSTNNNTNNLSKVITKPVNQMSKSEILAAIAQIQQMITNLTQQLQALTKNTTITNKYSCNQLTKIYSIIIKMILRR